ncbi:hypothetical protein BST83_18595 [Polaribacter filamentus]|uniref:DUF1566 domain-containing protein n=1 Tax=Polaribacter filamentus TaxID=53483 RepID=A0A2S7KL60_9FLAO|nr:DUF1566 domain-containing protein [Polaribacter filamentus]PQB03313.1 hypothetical protein BST83_18595 [Polaribacter filamentus]
MKQLLLIPMLFVCYLGMGQEAPEDIDIIGTPFTIGSIEVAQLDFENEINWFDSGRACAALGDGWRLPTVDELNVLYTNREIIGCKRTVYWSSTRQGKHKPAATRDFTANGQVLQQNTNLSFGVRAVRDKD